MNVNSVEKNLQLLYAVALSTKVNICLTPNQVRHYQDFLWVRPAALEVFWGQAVGCLNQNVTLGTRNCLHSLANLLDSC